MANPVTLRLDEKTRRRIARIARGRRVSTSEAIRDAIDRWIDRETSVHSLYDAVSDLIGVVRGRNRKRSMQTGRQFTKLLKRRRKRK